MPRPKRSNPQTKHRAIALRKESTLAERKLWSRIRNDQLGVTFRRHTCPGGRCQGHAIDNYIPDFCSPKARLILELDGSQHLEQRDYDKERTEYLGSKGYTVLRFWNNDVMNDIEGVIRAIIQAMESKRHLYTES
jgi:very-short-patch-repair endonuclease